MSLTSQSSVPSLKGQDHRSPAVIAAFNKRRLRGDYGVQPNAPSVGVKVAGEDANLSALKAVGSNLGPKLWTPNKSAMAARASSLATSSSASFIPEAHYVENPESRSLASLAATSAIATPGETYGARAEPDAYMWGKKPSHWQHEEPSAASQVAANVGCASNPNLAAQSSAAALQRAQNRRNTQRAETLSQTQSHSLPIDISKVLSAAQRNARARIDSADNHLPADWGTPSVEQLAQRRQQVLSLITIADKRVKDRMAELDRDIGPSAFDQIDFHRIALDVAARIHAPRLENHGKIDLGGGLYMTQDEIDDIARSHVQPVLDKVTLVAEKRRITDREHAERQAQQKQFAQEERERDQKRKKAEKAADNAEKQRKRQQEADAKTKAARAAARAREQHPKGSHLWHWQQVDILEDDVREAKNLCEEKQSLAARLRKAETEAKEDLEAVIARHHELKTDYFERGDQIEKKNAEYTPGPDGEIAETASLYSLKQRRETVKASTKAAKTKRANLEKDVEVYGREADKAQQEVEEATAKHHELKKKYNAAKEEAEEAEKEFQIEEEARLKREAEERAKREAEEAARRKRESVATPASPKADPALANYKTVAPPKTSAEVKKEAEEASKGATKPLGPMAETEEGEREKLEECPEDAQIKSLRKDFSEFKEEHSHEKAENFIHEEEAKEAKKVEAEKAETERAEKETETKETEAKKEAAPAAASTAAAASVPIEKEAPAEKEETRVPEIPASPSGKVSSDSAKTSPSIDPAKKLYDPSKEALYSATQSKPAASPSKPKKETKSEKAREVREAQEAKAKAEAEKKAKADAKKAKEEAKYNEFMAKLAATSAPTASASGADGSAAKSAAAQEASTEAPIRRSSTRDSVERSSTGMIATSQGVIDIQDPVAKSSEDIRFTGKSSASVQRTKSNTGEAPLCRVGTRDSETNASGLIATSHGVVDVKDPVQHEPPKEHKGVLEMAKELVDKAEVALHLKDGKSTGPDVAEAEANLDKATGKPDSRAKSNIQAVGGNTAGAVTSDKSAKKLTDDIPLGNEKDQFSGFDSSNVRETVDNKGVFKEEL